MTANKMIMAALLVIFFAATAVDGCCAGGYGWFPGCRQCGANTFDKRRDNNGVPSNAGALRICPRATTGMNLYSKWNCVWSGWLTACYSCPSGWNQPSTGQYNCVRSTPTCTSGQYSRGGACTDCPAGQYTGGFSGQTSCTSCAAGRYCAGRGETTNNNYCSAGRYGSSRGMTNSYCSAACPIGQYCVMGSTSGRNCPAGTMAATTSGLSSASQCVPCANGYTCPQRSGPVGSARPPAICGSSGSTLLYCSGGARTTPAAGYFASNPASAGSNTFTAQTKCPAGSYCPGNGRKVLCPAGKYGSSTGVSSSNCQGNCAAGYNCPAGSTGQFSQSCAPNPTNANSARTFYCPAGQGRQSINTATECKYSKKTSISLLRVFFFLNGKI